MHWMSKNVALESLKVHNVMGCVGGTCRVVGTRPVWSHPCCLLGAALEVDCSQRLDHKLPWREPKTGLRNELTFER